MTYKAIVKMMVRTEAVAWIEKLLEKNNISYKWTDAEVVSMENDKDTDTVLYDVRVDITLPGYTKTSVYVGGTVDDICGICTSCIWDRNHKDVIWYNVEHTREYFGIKEFKIA